MTYLPLQMVLYFNVFYSPLWVIVCIFTLENKVRQLCEPKKRLFVRDDVKTLSEYISNLELFWLLIGRNLSSSSFLVDQTLTLPVF